MITFDKIASITKNLKLSRNEEITDNIGTQMGDVLAVRVLEDKTIYNTLELTSGRMSVLKKGDVVACALGQRMALKGFVGKLPDTVNVGDVIHLLNLGGVAGICTSANVQEVGEPLRARVLGAVVRDGVNLNIGQAKIFERCETLTSNVPLIVVSGTSMDSGKTTVAAQVIKTLTRMGMRMGGTKLTGVGAWRDLVRMGDYGVSRSASFVDCGITSTANIDAKTLTDVSRGAIEYLSNDPKGKVDAIMIEFGDGLLGHYGAGEILRDKQIAKLVRLHIGCASDPIGALGLARECEDIGLPLDMMAGPVTDNTVGREFIKKNIKGVMPYNAFSPDSSWLNIVVERWLAAD